MAPDDIVHVKSLSQLMEFACWDKPNHPLVAVIDVKDLDNKDLYEEKFDGLRWSTGLYTIILKDGSCGMTYGRNKYDFEEGVL